MQQDKQLEGLRAQLLKTKRWPLKYMFKFVMPNDVHVIAEVRAMMPADGVISYKDSANGKYVAMTCVAMMPSADSIVEVTCKAASLPGVMSL